MSDQDQTTPKSGFHAKLENLAGKPLFWALFVLVAFSWPLVRAFMVEPLPDIPIVGTVQNFVLKDSRGLPLSSKKLQGRVWIAHAMCTSCASENAKIQEFMEDIQHRARNLGGALKLVSITVDPKRDGPEALAEYMSQHPISRGRWYFATGSLDEVQDLVLSLFDSQDLADIDSGIQGPVLPADRMWDLVLIDQTMQIRGRYDMRQEQAVNLLLFHAGLVVNRHR